MWKKKSVRSNHESRCSRVVDVARALILRCAKTGLDSGTCTHSPEDKQLTAVLGYFHKSERITISLNFSPLTRFRTYGSEKNIPTARHPKSRKSRDNQCIFFLYPLKVTLTISSYSLRPRQYPILPNDFFQAIKHSFK